jgi:crossover junction endodeoxyribonuclease RuvC
MVAPAVEINRWAPGTRGSAMALVQSQQITGSGLGIALRPLLFVAAASRTAVAVNLDPMRVFGIDCGTEVTGYGVVESADTGREPKLALKAMGAIRLKKALSTAQRLEQVFRELSGELERWTPDTVAIEEVFYSVNAKSALKLGQVRGVALLAAATRGLPVAEYAPLKIKSSVVGYGLAKKEQVQFMVARLLGLSEVPEPADAADALAIAICHIHTAQTLAAQGIGLEVGR